MFVYLRSEGDFKTAVCVSVVHVLMSCCNFLNIHSSEWKTLRITTDTDMNQDVNDCKNARGTASGLYLADWCCPSLYCL